MSNTTSLREAELREEILSANRKLRKMINILRLELYHGPVVGKPVRLIELVAEELDRVCDDRWLIPWVPEWVTEQPTVFVVNDDGTELEIDDPEAVHYDADQVKRIVVGDRQVWSFLS